MFWSRLCEFYDDYNAYARTLLLLCPMFSVELDINPQFCQDVFGPVEE